jgi:hypothetical protein
MIETIYKDMQGLTILEMQTYLRLEISKHLVGEYKDMTTEMKLYIYKLYSFLYFCNELKDKEKVLSCMQQMINGKEFKDRNQVLNKVK